MQTSPAVAERLIRTAEAARELGVAPSTLYRWAQIGLVTPATRTARGQTRWDLDDLRAQVQRLNAERDQQRHEEPDQQ